MVDPKTAQTISTGAYEKRQTALAAAHGASDTLDKTNALRALSLISAATSPDQVAALTEQFRQTLNKVNLGHVTSAAQAADMKNALVTTLANENPLVKNYLEQNRLTGASIQPEAIADMTATVDADAQAKKLKGDAALQMEHRPGGIDQDQFDKVATAIDDNTGDMIAANKTAYQQQLDKAKADAQKAIDDKAAADKQKLADDAAAAKKVQDAAAAQAAAASTPAQTPAQPPAQAPPAPAPQAPTIISAPPAEAAPPPPSVTPGADIPWGQL